MCLVCIEAETDTSSNQEIVDMVVERAEAHNHTIENGTVIRSIRAIEVQ